MILLDLFSGMGGFHKGLEDAGFKFSKTYFSEIDKHAIANYKYNFKDAEYVGSVTDVSGLPKVNIITFGSPCQDFSLAGKRKGMEGERSSLILHAIRLIRECRPDVFIWENVKGAFSSNNSADFWAIIQAFTNIGNYRLEWQLLNTSWFLPQNRERIYLVGHLTGRSEPRVFPIGENGTNYDEFRQEQEGEGARVHCLGTRYGQRWSDESYIRVKQVNDRKNFGDSTKQNDRVYDPSGIMASLGSHRLESKVNIIQPVITPNRAEKRQNGRRFKEDGEPAFTLNCQDQHGIMIDNSQIRRLTEVECERLQGFPDDWTKYGDYEGKVKEIAKTQRYKLCGNAVSTVVVKAIGERLFK